MATTTNLKRAMDAVDELDNQEFSALIDYIRYKVKARQQDNAARIAATLNVGDRVRLHSIKPLYLQGMTGTISSRRNTKFVVTLDRGPTKKFRSGEVICGAATLEKI